MKYPDTELQDAKAHAIDCLICEAHEDFEAWQAAHEEQVGDLDLIEQAEIYAKDSAWHSREERR